MGDIGPRMGGGVPGLLAGPGQRSASEAIKILRWGQGCSVQHPQVPDTPWTLSETRHMPSLVPPWHLLSAPPLPLSQGGQRLVCKQSRRVQARSPSGLCTRRPGPGPLLSSAWVRGHIPDYALPRKGQCNHILGGRHVEASSGLPAPRPWQGSWRLTPHPELGRNRFLPHGQWSEKGSPKSSQSGWSKVWEWPPALFPIPQLG